MEKFSNLILGILKVSILILGVIFLVGGGACASFWIVISIKSIFSNGFANFGSFLNYELPLTLLWLSIAIGTTYAGWKIITLFIKKPVMKSEDIDSKESKD